MIKNNPALSVRCTLSQGHRLNLLQCKASGGTGVDSYMALYDSLKNKAKKREIRGKELVKLCKFLNADPMEFAEREPAVK